jgi:hypothetical protein
LTSIASIAAATTATVRGPRRPFVEAPMPWRKKPTDKSAAASFGDAAVQRLYGQHFKTQAKINEARLRSLPHRKKSRTLNNGPLHQRAVRFQGSAR